MKIYIFWAYSEKLFLELKIMGKYQQPKELENEQTIH